MTSTPAGPAACDRRRDIRLVKKHFPGVDFSHIETNHDEVYEKHRMETEHAVQERGARFLQWLMSRCALDSVICPFCLDVALPPDLDDLRWRLPPSPTTLYYRWAAGQLHVVSG